MADFREKIYIDDSSEVYTTTPAQSAANQIQIASDDLADYTEDLSDRVPERVKRLNRMTAEFMDDVAAAIRDDRLIILESPRNGREVLLTPPAQTFREQLRADPDHETTIAEFNRMMGAADGDATAPSGD